MLSLIYLQPRLTTLAVLQVPLNFSISLLFLYHILGWCTFIGVFGVILLMPIPGYLTNWNASIQAKKLTKVRLEFLTVVAMIYENPDRGASSNRQREFVLLISCLRVTDSAQ